MRACGPAAWHEQPGTRSRQPKTLGSVTRPREDMRSRTGAGTLLTSRRARVGSRGRDLAYPRVSAVRAPHLNTMRHAEGKAQVEHQQHGAMWQAQAVRKERSRPASDTDKAAPQAGTAMLLPHDPQVLCQQATLPPLTSGAWCRLSGVDQEPPSASRLVSPWPPVNHKHYMTCGSEMAHASLALHDLCQLLTALR